jgi:hypothetical protein
MLAVGSVKKGSTVCAVVLRYKGQEVQANIEEAVDQVPTAHFSAVKPFQPQPALFRQASLEI